MFEDLILLVDLAIAVLIHDVPELRTILALVLARLIEIEHIRRLTYSVLGDGFTAKTCTAITATVNHGLFTIDLGNTVFIPSYVITEIPFELLAVIQDNRVDSELNTLVAERTDIGDHALAEVGTHRHVDIIEQVRCLTEIIVDRTGNTVVEESKVQTGIVGCRLLPSQIGVEGIRTIGNIERVAILIIYDFHGTGIVILGSVVFATHRIIRGMTYDLLVRRHVGVVSDTVLLTGDTVAETELEVVEPMHILHEGLFDLPADSNRREYTPAVILCETARTITTDGSCNTNLIPSPPVQTSEEGNEVVFTLAAIDRRISGLTCLGGITHVGKRIHTATFALILIVEMLPLVSRHDIEVLVCFLPVMAVLRVCGELEVVFHLLLPSIPTSIVASRTEHVIYLGFLTERIIRAEVGMEHQVLKAVDLIVCLHITNKLSGSGFM